MSGIPKAECESCKKTYYGWSLLYGEQECEECGQRLDPMVNEKTKQGLDHSIQIDHE